MSENGKKAAAVLTPEIRSKSSPARAKSLGKERLSEIARKGVETRAKNRDEWIAKIKATKAKGSKEERAARSRKTIENLIARIGIDAFKERMRKANDAKKQKREALALSSPTDVHQHCQQHSNLSLLSLLEPVPSD